MSSKKEKVDKNSRRTGLTYRIHRVISKNKLKEKR